MDPIELQGVMRVIGQQSNAIQMLSDQLQLKNEEIELLKERLKEYEPQNAEQTVDSGEMVHFDNGKNDLSPSVAQNGVAG